MANAAASSVDTALLMSMPTIPIHPPSSDHVCGGTGSAQPQILRTPSGLAILEIQGTVNAPTSAQQNGTGRPSTSTGKLIFPLYDEFKPANDTSWQKRVYLYVGKHQRLTGEVKKLSSPIAIIRRRMDAASSTETDELEIAEIVHCKLLFAHRPEPVGGGDG